MAKFTGGNNLRVLLGCLEVFDTLCFKLACKYVEKLESVLNLLEICSLRTDFDCVNKILKVELSKEASNTQTPHSLLAL